MTVGENGGCVLVNDCYPDWLSFSCDGTSVIFEAPQVEGHNLKSLICIANSSTRDNITSDGLKNVLVKNYTKATIQLYKREALASFEDEGQRLISSIEPGNKVEVVVVFENGLTVKKTTVYLVYDEPIGQKLEHCQTVEENAIVCSGDDNECSERRSSLQGELMDENNDAGSCCGFIKYSLRRWITNFMCRLVECGG